MSGGVRTCPFCAGQTQQRYCRDDGYQTVDIHCDVASLRDYRKDDLIGDRYRVIEPIGKGGATVVFDTEHIGTGQQVAVKVLSVDASTAEGMESVQRFFREARICAALQHDNTAQVFDVGQDCRGALYIAMERLTGETLAAVLQRRIIAEQTLTERETLAIGLGMLNALSAAHELGLVHRDLKPANVMLCLGKDGKQVVKVLDFGIARVENSALTRVGNMPGVPRYMSPEQCRNRKVDGRSDVYSLGCLLFACVTGHPPFEARAALDVMQMHVSKPAPDVRAHSPVQLSERFANAIARSLAKEPSDRFQTAQDMQHELSAILDMHRRASSQRVGTSSADPRKQAESLTKLAQQASDPARAHEYAKAAMKMDPRNLEARRIARLTLANLRRGSGAVPRAMPRDIPPPPTGPDG